MELRRCITRLLLYVLGTTYSQCYTLADGGQFDASFTLQSVWGRLQLDSRSIFQCLSDDNYKRIRISRKFDTGQGSRLPKLSQQFMQAKPVFARILFMPGEDKLNRFGAFQCKININHVSTEIVTFKLPPSSLVEVDALDPYKVASVSENVKLEVNITKKLDIPIKWRHNGVDVPAWENKSSVEIQDVQQTDAGIYECFYEGRRNESVHALMRLIVRGCAIDKYGKDCDEDCPPCYNGGICHDVWGVCVCPAGFTGENCEIACGGNRFGADCSKSCSPPQNNSSTDELCASHLFCKPDPYGCSCAPGFKGPNCMEHCESGLYGADCKQPCHCAYGVSSCNRITGACEGGCARGWRGNSCQIEDPNAGNTLETTTMVYCPLGFYGPSCERECHCAENEHCHVSTGHCPSGCEEGWGGPSCGKCAPGRFGTNCASTCHCHESSTISCNIITGVCEGDCEAGYMGNDCQTPCPRHKYGVNCIHDCFCMNGKDCNRTDGSCDCDGRWKGQTCDENPVRDSEVHLNISEPFLDVKVNDIIYIKCSGSPPLKWEFDNNLNPGNLKNLGNFSKKVLDIENESIIRLKFNAEDDTGRYRCRNNHSEASVYIFVNGDKLILYDLYTWISPDRKYIPCLPTASAVNMTLWLDSELVPTEFDPTRGFLLKSDPMEDETRYTCFAEYGAKIETEEIIVERLKETTAIPSVFIDKSNATYVTTGSNFGIICKVRTDAYALLSITWSYPVNDTRRKVKEVLYYTRTETDLTVESTLQVLKATESDTGVYRCKATDSSLKNNSAEVFVEVYGEPQIVAASDDEVNTGQQAFLSCTAHALPEPVMEISSSFSDSLQVHTRTLAQNLYQAIVKVKPEKAGQLEFLCKARNKHGFDMKKIILTVIEPPRLTSPPWLLSKTNMSVTVGWRAWVFSKDIGGTPTDKIEYMLMYRKQEASTWEKVDGWSTELSKTVKGLTPDTQYEIAVKCRRIWKGGEGDLSPSILLVILLFCV